MPIRAYRALTQVNFELAPLARTNKAPRRTAVIWVKAGQRQSDNRIPNQVDEWTLKKELPGQLGDIAALPCICVDRSSSYGRRTPNDTSTKPSSMRRQRRERRPEYVGEIGL